LRCCAEISRSLRTPRSFVPRCFCTNHLRSSRAGGWGPLSRPGNGLMARKRARGFELASVDANETARPAVEHVIGPGGRCLTLADLPLPDTKRWVIQRKAEVVAAVRGGLLSLEEACSRYALDCDEFMSWQRCIDRFGVAGLRTTWTQFYLSDAEEFAPSAGRGWRALKRNPPPVRTRRIGPASR